MHLIYFLANCSTVGSGIYNIDYVYLYAYLYMLIYRTGYFNVPYAAIQ